MSEKEKNEALEKDEKELDDNVTLKKDGASEEENKKDSKEESEDKEKKSEKKSDEKSKKKTDPKKLEKKMAKKNKRALKERAFKRGWFSFALVAFFIAGVILVNLIASTLVEKVPALVIDTSGSDNFELTDDTLDYLSTLKDDIKIIVLAEEKNFKDGGEYFVQANTLLHEYENKSDKITLEYVDLTSNPTFTSSYPDESLSEYSFIVQSDKGYRYITQQEYLDVQMDYNSYQYYIAGSKVEEAVTSAILNVTLEDKPKVTFISDINDNDYSYLKTYLENNGFETEEVSPAVNEIPEDTKILVLYTPSVDLDSEYVDSISEFLNNDGNYGKQFLYIPSEKLLDLPNIDSLLEEWGLSVEKGYAIENDQNLMRQISYGVYLFTTQYADTKYTANMKNSNLPFCVIGGYTMPINILDSENASSLFQLSDQSEVVYPVESSDEPEYKEVPNIDIGAIATKGASDTDTDTDTNTKGKTSNIVVIGSSVALSETLFTSSVCGNSTYTISLFNTLLDRENVGVSIESKSLESAELGITSAQLRVLTIIFVIIIPIAVLVTGIVIFMKRRNM